MIAARHTCELQLPQRAGEGIHEAETSMSTSGNKQVIRDFLEDVINQGRLERADALVKSEFIELDPLPGQRQGREGLKEVIGQIRSAFPDTRWVVDEMVAEDDKVVARFHWTGTHLGP